MFGSRKIVALALVAAMMLALCSWSSAAQYPNKTVQIIVPARAGGDTDTAARIFVKYLEKELGGTVVVVNVAGASGTIGTSQVYDSSPAFNYPQFSTGYTKSEIAPPGSS